MPGAHETQQFHASLAPSSKSRTAVVFVCIGRVRHEEQSPRPPPRYVYLSPASQVGFGRPFSSKTAVHMPTVRKNGRFWRLAICSVQATVRNSCARRVAELGRAKVRARSAPIQDSGAPATILKILPDATNEPRTR